MASVLSVNIDYWSVIMKKTVLLAMMLGLFPVHVMPSNSGESSFTAIVLFGLVGANVYTYWTRASQPIVNSEMKSTSVSCPNFSSLSASPVATSEDQESQTSPQTQDKKKRGLPTIYEDGYAETSLKYDEATVTLEQLAGSGSKNYDIESFAQVSPFVQDRKAAIILGSAAQTDATSLKPIQKYPIPHYDAPLERSYINVHATRDVNYSGASCASLKGRFPTSQSYEGADTLERDSANNQTSRIVACGVYDAATQSMIVTEEIEENK